MGRKWAEEQPQKCGLDPEEGAAAEFRRESVQPLILLGKTSWVLRMVPEAQALRLSHHATWVWAPILALILAYLARLAISTSHPGLRWNGVTWVPIPDALAPLPLLPGIESHPLS